MVTKGVYPPAVGQSVLDASMLLDQETRLVDTTPRLEISQGPQVLVKATPGTQPNCSNEDDSQEQASLCYALMDRQTQQLPMAPVVPEEPSRLLVLEGDKSTELQQSPENSCQQSQVFSHFGLGADPTNASGVSGRESVAGYTSFDQSDKALYTDAQRAHEETTPKESAAADCITPHQSPSGVGPATSSSQPLTSPLAPRTAKASASRSNPRPKPLLRSSNQPILNSSASAARSGPLSDPATDPVDQGATTQLESQLYGQDVYPVMQRRAGGRRGMSSSAGRQWQPRRPTTSTPVTALRPGEDRERESSPFDDSFTRPTGALERERFFGTSEARGLNVSVRNLLGETDTSVPPPNPAVSRSPAGSPSRSPASRSPWAPGGRLTTSAATRHISTSPERSTAGLQKQSEAALSGPPQPKKTGRTFTQAANPPPPVPEGDDGSEELQSQMSSLSVSSAPPADQTQQKSLGSSILVPETPSNSTGSGDGSIQNPVLQAVRPVSAPPAAPRTSVDSSQPSSISSFTDLPPAAQPPQAAHTRSISSLEYSSGSHPSRGSDENSDPNARPPPEVKLALPAPSTPTAPRGGLSPVAESQPEVEITPTQPSGIDSQDPAYIRFRDRFLQPVEAQPAAETRVLPRRLSFSQMGPPQARATGTGAVPRFGVPPPPTTMVAPVLAQTGRPPLVQLQRSNRPNPSDTSSSPQALQPAPAIFQGVRARNPLFDEPQRPPSSHRSLHPHPLSRDRNPTTQASTRQIVTNPTRQLQPRRRQLYEDDQDDVIAATQEFGDSSKELTRSESAARDSSPEIPLSKSKGKGKAKATTAVQRDKEDAESSRPKKPSSSARGGRATRSEARGRSSSRGRSRASKRRFAELDDQSEEEGIDAQFDVTIPTQRAQEVAKEILAGQTSSPIRRYGDPRSSASPRQYMSKAKQARKRPRLTPERGRSADVSDDEHEVDNEVLIADPSPARTDSSKRDRMIEVVIPQPSPSLERVLSRERGKRGRSATRGRRGSAPSKTRRGRKAAADELEDRDAETSVERRDKRRQEEAEDVHMTTEDEGSDNEPGPSSRKRPRSFSEPLPAGPSTGPERPSAKRRKTSVGLTIIPVTKVFAYWPNDKSYYPATVIGTSKGKFKVKYDDGDVKDLEAPQLRRGELRIGDSVHFKSSGHTGIALVHDVSLWPEGPIKILMARKGKAEIVLDVPNAKFRIPSSKIAKDWSDRLVDREALLSAFKPDQETVIKPLPAKTRARSKPAPVTRGSVRPSSSGRKPLVQDVEKPFSGIAFVITMISSKDLDRTKAQLKKTITEGGGHVFESWHELYAVKFTPGQVISRNDLKWVCKKKDVKNVLLLSDRPTHTPKYLMALALGIPCVSTKWVEVHSSGFAIGWQSYLLAAGKTEHMNDLEVSQYLDPAWSKDERLIRDVFLSEVIRRPWTGLSILCVFEASRAPNAPRTVFVPMMCAMGASKIEVVSNINGRNDLQSFDFVIFKDDDPTMKRLDEDIGYPIRTVNWFKQCLIMGAVLPV